MTRDFVLSAAQRWTVLAIYLLTAFKLSFPRSKTYFSALSAIQFLPPYFWKFGVNSKSLSRYFLSLHHFCFKIFCCLRGKLLFIVPLKLLKRTTMNKVKVRPFYWQKPMTEQIGTASLLCTPCNWWVGLDNHTRLHIGWVHIEVIFVCMHHMISKTNLQAFIKKCKDVVALVGCLFVFFRNNFDKIYGSQRVIIISTMYKKIILFFKSL